MSCCSSQVAVEAAPAPPTSTTTPTSMSDLNNYFSRLMLRELDNFRAGPPNPAAETTIAAAATEVADTTTASPPATGQAEPTTPAETANSPSPSPSPTPSSPTTITTAAEEKEETKNPATPHPKPAASLPATGIQAGTPLRLLTIPNTTDRQRRNNGARQQRVYRLAAKFGVSPGAARWVRGGQAYAQPAVPRAVVVVDNNNKTVEYNQFMYSDSDKVVLRMPGGWKRDLVRTRPQFRGVAVIDGFLWPRFSPNLPRRMTVDWEEQGFVEFNEVRYATPFVAREPRAAAAGAEEEEDGVLIRFDE